MECNEGVIRGGQGADIVGACQAAIVVDDHGPLAEFKSISDHGVIVVLSASVLQGRSPLFFANGRDLA